MIHSVDLVMWTKNGATTLPEVLGSIDQVVPKEVIHKRVIVDDNSTDNTREIAKKFGWTVVFNDGNGISDGANTALKHVESDFFISFEQDLVLAQDWWQKIPKYLSNPKTAVASGIRLPNQPSVVKAIQEYSMERNRQDINETAAFLYGKTLDNTIYKTSVIKKIGGFPKITISAGVDNMLAKKISAANFEWKVDYNVCSIHLRKNLRQELAHNYWYGVCFSALSPMVFNQNVKISPIAFRVFLSPIRALEIAVKKCAPQAIYAYPLMRFMMLKGILRGIKHS
ncbi:MAG: glycosyltransferase family 2 protein [Crenarchaeota archaeon]|nr:glycosyltransferase family 2 protein [Thermoproteota archaeon]